MAKAKKRSPGKPATEPVVDAPAIIREKIGSGMTERTRTTYRAWTEGLRDIIAGPPGGFFHALDDMLREFLRNSAIPDPTEGRKFPNRSHVTADLAKQEYDSMLWYAAAVRDELNKVDRHLARASEAAEKLSKRSNRINKAVAEGLLKECKLHSHNAALAAYRAGVLNQEARGKYESEETWTHGKKYRGKQSDRGQRRGEQQSEEKKPEHDRWQREAERIWKKRPARFKTDVARKIQEKIRKDEKRKVSFSTIYHRIRKPT